MSDPVARLNAALSGRYRLERQLGEGGMATVYLASDLKHDRKVALKVLKPELAAVVGAERFLAEIRTTANLQHPHILPLHDSGEADGLLFYVMPYIEGETLRDRLDREHQLPIDEAVRIATNVAEALDYAHRHGVIHRDIKPANILLVDGKPVVADFGIALAVTSGSAGRMTETGLSLGTPHYMSPEQATGDAHVGPATDIWALGCVLYEMLAGEPPYAASTPQAVLGKIITAEPPSVVRVRKSVPRNLDAAIRTALEKVPADRFRSAALLAGALNDPRFERSAAMVGRVTTGRWAPLAVTIAGVLTAVAVGVAWILGENPDEPRVTLSELSLPEGVTLYEGNSTSLIEWSPGGDLVVFVGVEPDGDTKLWQRRLDQSWPTPIPGTEGATSATFSPDGTSILFRIGPQFAQVSLHDGGLSRWTVEGAIGFNTAIWANDGFVYFNVTPGGIFRVPAGGGEATVVSGLREGDTGHLVADPLPNGDGLLFTRRGFALRPDSIGVVSLETGEIRILLLGRGPRYIPPGYILFDRDGALFIAPFDTNRLEVTGPARQLVDGLWTTANGSGRWAVSESGNVAYVTGGTAAGSRLVWVDRRGVEDLVDPGEATRLFNNQSIALSPDDTKLVVGFPAEEGATPDLWVKELSDGTLTRLTDGEISQDRRPVWSVDADSVIYLTNLPGGITELRRARADGEGNYDVVLGPRDPPVYEMQYSHDLRLLIFREGDSTQGVGNIGYIDLSTGQIDPDIVSSDFIERSIALSPDGRWLAYVSNETGRDEVYVRPAPPTDGLKVTISRNGGIEPVWAHNGRELFFREPATGSMMVVAFATGPDFQRRSVDPLFDASRYLDANGAWRSYDVTRDDQRFVMIRPERVVAESSRLMLLQNLFGLLERTTPE
jgi:serine/threonine-protein kinase